MGTGCRNGGETNHGTFDMPLLETINELYSKLGWPLLFPDVKPLPETEETFGFAFDPDKACAAAAKALDSQPLSHAPGEIDVDDILGAEGWSAGAQTPGGVIVTSCSYLKHIVSDLQCLCPPI